MTVQPPLYRVSGHGPFEVDLWEKYGSIKDIASCLTRETAIAVLRLMGAEVFHDWTQPRAHWDMPVSEVP